MRRITRTNAFGWAVLSGPTASGSNGDTHSSQLASDGRGINAEAASDGGERLAAHVAARCVDDIVGAHLALVRPAWNPELLQVGSHGVVVHAEHFGDRPQRSSCPALDSYQIDLRRTKSTVHRTESGV